MTLIRFALCAGVLLASAARAAEPPPGGCHYEITLEDVEASRLRIAMACAGEGPFRLESFGARTDANVSELRAEGGSRLESQDGWRLSGAAGVARASYRFAFERADGAGTAGIGQRVGRSMLTTVRAFLLLPDGGRSGRPLTLRFQAPSGAQVATGLAREGELHLLDARDLPFIGFAAMGRFESWRVPVAARGGGMAQLDAAVLDAPYALDREQLADWLAQSARAVADYFGGFPARRGLLVLRPIPDRRGLLRGMVNGGGGATMLLLIGASTETREMFGQWMLMHELAHFGAPFIADHVWIMEGMAVYVETALRVRAGWFPADQAWRGFMRNVPQGVPAMEGGGLNEGRGIGAVYWGGTLFWLLADIETLERSGGARSIADCFQAVLDEGGDTSARWPIERFIAACDSGLGGDTVSRLYQRFAQRGSPVDLFGLWQKLGLRLTENEAGVAYDDTAPLAWVRKRIIRAAQ